MTGLLAYLAELIERKTVQLAWWATDWIHDDGSLVEGMKRPFWLALDWAEWVIDGIRRRN